MLGIVGDSGSGKSTLIQGLLALFPNHSITEICLDDYHSYDRATRTRLGLTALDPAANNLQLMTGQLRCLREGIPIFKPTYNHATGTFGPEEWVMPGEIIVVHGLFTLFSAELTDLFDLGIYLDPEPELRLAWKIRRDTRKRGYRLEEVLNQIEARRPDAAAYIEPQQANADLVVSFRRSNPAVSDEILDAQLYRRAQSRSAALQTWANPSLSYLRLSEGEYLKIPAQLDNLAALALEWHWQKLAGLEADSGLNLGLYQGANGQWRRSFSLSLTQLLIAGSLLEERKSAMLVA
jgi:phosphoribulokinase